MNWSRVPTLAISLSMSRPHRSSYLSEGGAYRVAPVFARGRGGRRTKRVAWELTEGGRRIGNPMRSAAMAKAFAAELAELGDDRRARAAFIRDGGEWCWQWQQARTAARDQAWYAKYAAEREEAR